MQKLKSEEDYVLVLVHRVFKGKGAKLGGADYIARYLADRNFIPVYVEHPLEGVHPTRVRLGDVTQYEVNVAFSGVVRWVFEIIYNIWFYLHERNRYRLILAVDPLNFLSAYVMGLLGGIPVHFHSIDYSEERFDNEVLNGLYNLIYAFAARNADLVTFVSASMGKKLKEISGKDSKATYFHLPNSPEFTKIERLHPVKKNKFDLVYTKTHLSESEIKRMVSVIKLVVKKYKEIKLHIVGDVPQKYKKLLRDRDVSKNFMLHGIISYEDNLEIVSKSYVGLAWYERKISFEKYADSLKLREYAASGVPAICNDGIETASEMKEKGAGVIANSYEDMAKSILRFLDDKDMYLRTREKAIKWAKEMDKVVLLDNLYKKIF